MYIWNNINEVFRDVKYNDIKGKLNNLNYYELYWYIIYNVWCNYYIIFFFVYLINVVKGFSVKVFMYVI